MFLRTHITFIEALFRVVILYFNIKAFVLLASMHFIIILAAAVGCFYDEIHAAVGDAQLFMTTVRMFKTQSLPV